MVQTKEKFTETTKPPPKAELEEDPDVGKKPVPKKAGGPAGRYG